MPKKNHLAGQASLYLRQHEENPVDWYPWGDEALSRAAQEDKPLLVSIGYSACHWCHVMERESFEDDEVARVMNNDFVCVKVDREERPDLDHLYINAVQMLTGQAGWPLNCFALPDGRPFWGGTYFPRSQWLSILRQIAEVYKQEKAAVQGQAQNLAKGSVDSNLIPITAEKASFDEDDARRMYDDLIGSMDTRQGGNEGAPKFPLPENLAFLLHYYRRTGEQKALEQVKLTLDKMARGGIYDQLGGGFARYSTDAQWKVPHFEKMLYDNGQLAALYANAWKITKEPLYKETVYGIVRFIENELMSPEGAFYSSLDADSEGEEGKYYLWTEDEIDRILGPDAALFKEYFRVGGEGLWEAGRNILLRTDDEERIAGRASMDLESLQRKIADSRNKLLEARERRESPALDDKVLISWNGMMIHGLAEAYATFQEDRFLRLAENASDFILDHAFSDDGRLGHTLKNGEVVAEGFLEDYAHLARAMIRLYEVSMRSRYIQAARKMIEYVWEHFTGKDTRLFAFSPKAAKTPAAHLYEFTDNVIPSSNSVLARVLLYLSDIFERPQWAERSSLMLADMRRHWGRFSFGMTGWGQLLMHQLGPFYTVVVAGPEAERKAAFLNQCYLPDKVLAAAGAPEEQTPPVFFQRFTEGKTLIHVCQKGACKLPVEDEQEALQQLLPQSCS